MAAGDITMFYEFFQDIGEEVHDFANDTIKLGLITDVITPLANADTPRWDDTSGQDYDGNEVTDAGNYTADGVTIPVTWERTTDTASLKHDNGDIEWSQNAIGFGSDPVTKPVARWGILYNSSATNKNAICFIDFGSSGLDEAAGAVKIYWNETGIFTITEL
jgi:hypothetical protein